MQLRIVNKNYVELDVIIENSEFLSDKILIMLNAFKSKKEYPDLMNILGGVVGASGCSLLRFDFSGMGKSGGDFLDSTVYTEVEDVRSVIKYVKSVFGADIYLGGISLGATEAILSYENDMKGLLLLSPIFNTEILYDSYRSEFRGRDSIVKTSPADGSDVVVARRMWESFKECQNSIEEMVKEIKSPLLIVSAEHDKLVNDYDVKKYRDMMPSRFKETVAIADTDHGFTDKYSSLKVAKFISDFANKYF